MFTRTIAPLFTLFLTIAIFTVGCGDNGSSTSPSTINSNSSQGSSCLGYFKIIPGEDLSSAEILPVRTSQFDVTPWAEISILSAEWDPSARTWTLTVQVTNPTPLTGYGVQAIFTDLGGKEMRWPDGYLWMNIDIDPEDERVPFFAIEKDTLGREFVGLHSSTRDLVFYFPQGVDLWIPISFFLDAHLDEPRPDPMVEDMNMGYTPPPCMHSTVLAKIDDHQSPLEDLTVWVDLSPIGGSETEPMLDDGENDDGLAGDGIFGAQFTGGTFGELYTFTVYASDPEDNTAENDIWFSPIMYPPLPPLDFETLMQDQFCLLTQERLQVIEDQDEWLIFWDEFSVWDMPAPDVDFETKNVIAVCLGQRDNDCYSVNIDTFNYSQINCGVAVGYTETVPEDGCPCAEIITTPFHLVTASKTWFDTIFIGDIFIDCPADPCLDLFEIRSGTHGSSDVKNTSVIFDQAAWESWWAGSAGGGTPPPVDFETEMVIGANMGTQNSSGHYATVDSACWDDTMQLEITVGWHYPGEGCMVLWVMTNPWICYRTERTLLPYYFTTYDDVYRCD